MSLEEIKISPTLQKVKKSIEEGKYSENFWLFIFDVHQAFQFILDNFNVRKALHQCVLELIESFYPEMDEFMKSRGFCCGTWQVRKSKDVLCSGKKCIIASYTNFYRFSDWTFCEKCFNKFPNDAVKLCNDS